MPPKAPRFKSISEGNYSHEATNKVFNSKFGLKDQQPVLSFSVKDKQSVTFIYKSDSPSSTNIETKGQELTFRNIEPNVDLRYQTLPLGIKEEIILQKPRKEKNNSNVFMFDSIFQGAYPKEVVDGITFPVFYDENGNYLFHFEKPFAIDAAGNRTDAVALQIEDKSSSKIHEVKRSANDETPYLIRLTVDEKWLNDSARVYPITIDPTVIHDESSEFATGSLNRVKDTGSGSSPSLETYYQELPADENTVALWHLNEVSGNAIDDSGNSNTGTATGTSVIDGILNNARSFNGTSSDYIVVADSPSLQMATELTIETWFKTSAAPASNVSLVRKDSVSGTRYLYGIMLNTSGIINAQYYNGANFLAASSNTVTDGKWHHAANVISNGRVYLYLDGVLQSSVAITGTQGLPNGELNIGANPPFVGGGARSYNYVGSIDEVRISNIARSAEEIKASASRRPYSIYTSEAIDLTNVVAWNSFSWSELGVATGDGETPFDATGLVAQWSFNETSGTTASNASGSCGASCNGSLTSFASTASQDQAAGTGWTSNNRRWGAGALMFDGTNDHVSAGTVADLKFTSDFTLEAWIKPLGDATGQILSYGTNSDWLYALGGTANSPLCKTYQANSGAGHLQIVGTKPVTDGKWHHVVCTLSGTTLSLYIDGILDVSTSTPTGSRDVSTAGTFTIGRFTNATSTYYTGLIDVVRAYSRPLSPSEIVSNYQAGQVEFQTRVGTSANPDDGTWDAWSPTASEADVESFDSLTPNLVSYWPMAESSGTNVEDIETGNDGTATNTSIVDGIYGNSRSFGGTSYITVADDASLDITGNFTVMAWIYRTGGTNGYIATKFGTSAGGGYGLLHGNLGEVYCRTDNGTTYTDSYTATGYVTTSSGWVHTAIVRTGTSCRVFINGVDQTVTANTHTTVAANSQPFKIGAAANDNSSPVVGNIDEVRVFNSALSASEIQAYMADAVPGATSNTTFRTSAEFITKLEGSRSQKIDTGKEKASVSTIALWHLEETGGITAYLKDSSGRSFHGAPMGTSVVNGISGKARGFNGSSDYIDIGDPSAVDFGSGNFTIEAWVKRQVSGTNDMIVAKDIGGTNSRQFFLGLISTNIVRISYFTSGNAQVYLDSTATITDSNWHHIVGQRSGNSFNIYIDGVLSASGTTAGAHGTMLSTTTNLTIGKRLLSGNEDYFAGVIDKIKISSGALTASEIAETHRAGRDHYLNKTISSTDLSSKLSLPFYIAADRPGTYLETSVGESAFANYVRDSNTVALWHFDEESGSGAYLLDSSGNNRNGTPTGTISAEGIVGKARSFNGTSDKVMASAPAFNYDSLTIEAWVKTNTLASRTTVVDLGTETTLVPQIEIGTGSGGTNVVTIITPGVFQAQTVNNVISTGVWTHIAYTKNGVGATHKIYVNGVEMSLAINASADYASTATNTTIGTRSASSQRFDGEIDQVRVSNVTRTADEIRQAYEIGLRSHPITIDFAASLDSGNLISGSGDTSFTIDATSYGLEEMGSALYKGDKIIVRENYNGTEYIAQGNVSAISPNTGATTVVSWDSDSTFPSGGYTVNADVFKWQREYWPIFNNTLSSHMNAVTNLNLRLTDGNEGRTIWIDDLNSSGNYLTNPLGSTMTSDIGNQYFQYRAILSSLDENLSATISAVTLDYVDNTPPETPTLDSPIGEPEYGGMLAYCDGTGEEIYYRIMQPDGTWTSAAIAADVDGSTTNKRCHTARVYSDPDSDEKILMSGHHNGTTMYVYGQVWDGVSWGNVQEMGQISTSNFWMQKYDGVYLANDDFMAFYLDSSVNGPQFAIWSGGTWSTVDGTTQLIGNSPNQMIAKVRPGTNEVMVVMVDSGSDTETIYYDGSGIADTDFTRTQLSTTGNSSGGRTFDFTWSRNNPLRGEVVYTNSAIDQTPSVNVFTADGIGGGSWGTLFESIDIGEEMASPRIVDRPNSNEFLMTIDGTTLVLGFEENDNDTSPTLQSTTNGTLATATEVDNDSHSHDLAYEQESGDLAVAVYSDNTNTPKLKTYDPSTNTWSASAVSLAVQTNTLKNINVIPHPFSDDMIFLTRDISNDLHTTFWDGVNDAIYATGDRANIEHATNCSSSSDAHCGSFAWNLNGAGGAVNQSLTLELKTTSNDVDSDYLRYKIELCEDLAMTTNCQTFDQTSSQTGWSSQNTETNTAYTSGTQATYTVQTPLTPATTYYWRSYAIDPAGTNTWSNTQSPPSAFTTTSSPLAPTDPYTEGSTNPTEVDDITPEFSAVHNDLDSDPAVYYEVEVNDASDFTGTVMWDSNQQSMASTADGNRSPDISYAGSTLSWGDTYYWRIRFWDNLSAVSPWSDTQQFSLQATPLPATACFAHENIANDQILISWIDNSSSENFYEVQRSVNGGSFAVLQTGMAANSTSLLDTDVSPDNTYQYRVAPYFTGPLYAGWCLASPLDLGVGLFNLEGIKASGLRFD